MNFGSVCSGIEAASVAWHRLGWRAAFLSEIERFPCAVLAHHYPSVPNFGDMTRFMEWPDANIDVLVGGTPCQSFSVAGLRKGLDDPRGNLMLTYGAIAGRYRPRWLVWENVPGVLSSNGGRDFGAFLGMLGELGYGFAYRVLDAQHFGVPQRRRRVFVVGCLGDWRRAAAVLFERHSLQGNIAPSREARKGSTGFTPSSFGGYREGCGSLRANGGDYGGGTETLIPSTGNVAHCLNAGGMGRQDYETETLIAHSLRGEGFDAGEDGTGRGTPLVPVAFNLRGREDGAQPEPDPDNIASMRAASGGSSRSYVAFAENSRSEVRLEGGDGSRVGALSTGGGKPGQGAPMIAFTAKDHGADAMEDCSPTLRAGGHSKSHANAGVMPAVAFNWQSGGDCRGLEPQPITSALTKEQTPASLQGSAVRRLTPVECERLQGFPDGYTDIRPKGKSTPDGPRYKALGNSMAVPVMTWIGQRIAAVSNIL